MVKVKMENVEEATPVNLQNQGGLSYASLA